MPVFLKSSVTANGQAAEFAVTIGRKTASEIGFNGSETRIWDAMFTALDKDAKVAGAFLEMGRSRARHRAGRPSRRTKVRLFRYRTAALNGAWKQTRFDALCDALRADQAYMHSGEIKLFEFAETEEFIRDPDGDPSQPGAGRVLLKPC